MRALVRVAIMTVLLLASVQPGRSWRAKPVILIPGAGGSQLEARWEKPSTVNWRCAKRQTEWTSVWLNTASLVFSLDNFRLVFNRETRTSANAPGVDVRVRAFGLTDGIEYLDPRLRFATPYLNDVVSILKGAGCNVRAAPYDHRFATDALERSGYHDALAALIEDAVRDSSGRRAILVSHSLGGPLAAHFLASRTATWREEFVASLIALAPPWGGVPDEIRVVASGSGAGTPVSPLALRREQRTSEISYSLMPTEAAFGDAVLATLHGRNFTARTLTSFLREAVGEDACALYERVHPLSPPPDPGITGVTVLLGSGVQTTGHVAWSGSVDHQPDVTRFVDGDGTVPTISARGDFMRWANPPVIREFPGRTHSTILHDTAVLEELLELVMQN